MIKELNFLKIISRILQKLLIILPKNVENLSKNLNVNFQKWKKHEVYYRSREFGKPCSRVKLLMKM